MAKTRKLGGLGRGLEALIPAMPEPYDTASGEEGAMTLPLDSISVNPYQPRRTFDDERLAELAESIKEHGVLQPILVRRLDEGYQLVAGERRARAARRAGLTEIPALVREMSEREMMELSLIENIQRHDLDPVEESRAYRRLATEFGLTQEQIAQRVSKSRPYIANSIRLLNLPEEILNFLAAGKLSVGHARPLLTLSAEDSIGLAGRLIDETASVRDAEQWAREMAESRREAANGKDAGPGGAGDGFGPEGPKGPEGSEGRGPQGERGASLEGEAPGGKGMSLPVALREIQRIIRDTVNTKVEITRGARGGKIIIEYYNEDDVERILELITGSAEIG